jgi:hypothetical protein
MDGCEKLLAVIQHFFVSFGWVFEILSIIISSATLIATLRFRHKLYSENEKQSFRVNKTSLLNEILAYQTSIADDGLYKESFLRKVDLFLVDIINSYQFLPFCLRYKIQKASKLIRNSCIPEVKNKHNTNKHELCRQLTVIHSLLKKEI